MNACGSQKNAAPIGQSRRTLNMHFKNVTVGTLVYSRALWFVRHRSISLAKFLFIVLYFVSGKVTENNGFPFSLANKVNAAVLYF